MSNFDELADRLDAIAEEIAEASITELKAALRRGEQKRPQLERTLSQAKRSIDKAAHLLRRAESDEVD